jgi:hypothetical protein
MSVDSEKDKDKVIIFDLDPFNQNEYFQEDYFLSQIANGKGTSNVVIQTPTLEKIPLAIQDENDDLIKEVENQYILPSNTILVENEKLPFFQGLAGEFPLTPIFPELQVQRNLDIFLNKIDIPQIIKFYVQEFITVRNLLAVRSKIINDSTNIYRKDLAYLRIILEQNVPLQPALMILINKIRTLSVEIDKINKKSQKLITDHAKVYEENLGKIEVYENNVADIVKEIENFSDVKLQLLNKQISGLNALSGASIPNTAVTPYVNRNYENVISGLRIELENQKRNYENALMEINNKMNIQRNDLENKCLERIEICKKKHDVLIQDLENRLAEITGKYEKTNNQLQILQYNKA